ncbi:MAG: hypothetical protein DRN66_01635 [Candidatus Nanohalarchaeota archaeon]|nr:MAG: hypothetical protein DRN66_01635 [Candidatus Nanohaloarchaeota archaeon]
MKLFSIPDFDHNGKRETFYGEDNMKEWKKTSKVKSNIMPFYSLLKKLLNFLKNKRANIIEHTNILEEIDTIFSILHNNNF